MKLSSSYLLATMAVLPAAFAAPSNLRRLPGNSGNAPGQSPGGPGNGGGNNPNDGQDTYIVTFKNKNETPSKRCEALSNAQGGSTKSVYNKVLNGCAMRLPPGALAAMKNNPNIERVEQNAIAYTSQDFSGATWGLDRVNQCSLPLDQMGTRQDATGVKVYILDTGIRGDHVDVSGSISAGSTCHVDLMNEGNALNDGHGHGTHVASTTCGTTYGVASNCELCAVKVLAADGFGSLQAILDGLEHVANDCNGERCVANLSLGFDGVVQSANDAVAAAVNAGVTVVVAAGNSNANACNFSPASEPLAITVGSTTNTDARSSFSNFGECLDVFAPGSSITAAGHTSPTAITIKSGTSMASPHVAGIAAGILGQQGALTPAQVLDAITTGSADGITNNQSPGVPLATTAFCTSAPTPPPVPTPPPTPCSASNLAVQIVTDNYPSETTWTLTNDCTGAVAGTGGGYTSAGTTYIEEMCEEPGQYTFTINDAYGDGICCSWGSGSYEVTMGGTVMASGGNFTQSESTTFGTCGTTPPPVAPTPPPVAPTNPPTPPPTTLAPTAPPTSQPTSMCKLVQVQVTDSMGVVHTLGPITISEDSEVGSVNFNVLEQGMTTCPGTESLLF